MLSVTCCIGYLLKKKDKNTMEQKREWDRDIQHRVWTKIVWRKKTRWKLKGIEKNKVCGGKRFNLAKSGSKQSLSQGSRKKSYFLFMAVQGGG